MGGVGIPLGDTLHSQQRLGERLDNSGNIISYVEKRKIKEGWYHVASVEGPGRHRIIHTKYFLVKGGKSYDLEFIKFNLYDGSLKSRHYIEFFLPSVVPEQWITFRQLDSRKGSYDIEMVIFDSTRIVQTKTVLNCERKCSFAESLEDYGIYLDLKNGEILFRTLNGNIKIDLNDFVAS